MPRWRRACPFNPFSNSRNRGRKWGVRKIEIDRAEAPDEVQDGLVMALLTAQRDRAEIDEQIAALVAARAAKRGVSIAVETLVAKCERPT